MLYKYKFQCYDPEVRNSQLFSQPHSPHMLINMFLEIQVPNCIILIFFFLNHSYPECGNIEREGEAELGIKDVAYVAFAKNQW